MAHVDLVQNGRTLEIGLNKAPVNSIDAEFSKEIYAALKQLQDDPGLSVGIIHSLQPKAFSAGWDMKAAASEGAGGGFQMTDAEGQDVFGAGGFAGITEFWGLNKPVIAALDAPAVGGGFEIALACDIIVASKKVYFRLPEMARGILPDAGGIQRLPRLVPRNVAREMLFTGRRMQAEEAARWGLVCDVVLAGQALVRARELAADVTRGAPLALAALKEALALTETMDMRQSIEIFRGPSEPRTEGYRRMMASEDAVEGVTAFSEKRDPIWNGR